MPLGARGAYYAVVSESLKCCMASGYGLSSLQVKVNYCVVFSSSRVSLKVHKAKCVPRDPTTNHPSVFKGPTSCPYWLDITCPVVCCGLIS